MAEWLGDENGDEDRHELSLALGGIAALISVGRHCVRRAHTQVLFDRPITREVPHAD